MNSADEPLTAQPDAQALIELSFGDFDPNKLATDSLFEGIDKLAGLSLPGFVQVIVTAEFEESFEEHVKPKYSECFTQRRVGGVVLAKTVTDGGSSTIILDVRALIPDVAEQLSCPLSRILEHEGQHLLLRARHEDAHTTHGRSADCETPTGCLKLLAALAIEEFRVESALTRVGSFKDENNECTEVLHLVARQLDVLRAETAPDACDAELGVCFRDLVVLVAERVAGRCGEQPIPYDFTSHPAVSVTWSRFSATLADIPASDVPITGATLNEHVDAVAVLLEEWLHHLGFAFDASETDRVALVRLNP